MAIPSPSWVQRDPAGVLSAIQADHAPVQPPPAPTAPVDQRAVLEELGAIVKPGARLPGLETVGPQIQGVAEPSTVVLLIAAAVVLFLIVRG